VPTKEKRTERELLDMLRARHGEVAGNGRAWVLAEHVRDQASFDANRTLDAIAMATWKSKGLVIDGFEVKTSRSDWLRELKDPSKAEAFMEKVDRFWLVVGERSIVKPGELPAAWGLLYAHGNALRCDTQAQWLHPWEDKTGRKLRPLPPGLSRSFLAAWMRAASAPAVATPEEIVKAREAGAEDERRARQFRRESEERYRQMWEEECAVRRDFERGLGCAIASFSYNGVDPQRVGETLRAIVHGEVNVRGQINTLRRIADDAERLATSARERLERLEGAGELVETAP
jgi:hypothetical protein